MSRRSEPQLDLIEAWGQRGVPLGDPDAMERQRVATVEAMERVVRDEHRRKRRARRLFVALAAVAGLAAAGGVYLLRAGASPAEQVAEVTRPPSSLEVTSGIVFAVRDGRSVSVVPGAPHALAERDELRTGPGAGGLVSFPRGVKVTLAPSTHATVVAAGELEQRVGLALGTVSVSVPRPGGPSTFVVSTPDTQVVVHGTQFVTRVERREDGSTRTFVAVTRGAVKVVHGDTEGLVTAGQSWASPEPGGDRSAAGNRAEAPAPRPHQSHAAAARAAADALAEQNRLFQAALDARAAGDDAAVVKHLEQLLARFPTTTLAQEARLVRFRALKRLGRDREAAREAGRYLTEHPDAPSRAEALELVNP